MNKSPRSYTCAVGLAVRQGGSYAWAPAGHARCLGHFSMVELIPSYPLVMGDVQNSWRNGSRESSEWIETAVLDVSSGHSMNNGLESAGTLTTNWENNWLKPGNGATSGNHLFRRSTRTSMTAWMNYTICIQQLYNIYP